MLNHITVQGRLVAEPELRTTQNQTSVTKFTLAVDRDYQSGGSEKQTDFIECVAWRQTAEFVSKFFRKGQMALVSGTLQSRKWQDKGGNSRTSWEVVVDRVHFCGDRKSEQKSAVSVPFEELDGEDSELPF